MKHTEQISRRRSLAIISHPDAGKTTLTEKLLLYGGALQLAGSVTARKNQRATTSDWMELEKKRGISITSTVLQFEYNGYSVNLLDTPGHEDFSEDTYRVLTAVDSVIMVIDAGKGIENQTKKLFEICRLRQVPIFTFINKLDRPSKDPISLLDELENTLGISATAVTWPLGNGSQFKGVIDRLSNQVHLFERTPGGTYRSPVSVSDISDPILSDTLSSGAYTSLLEELDVLDTAGSIFSEQSVLNGSLTPVLFGSASNNFGIKYLLDFFIKQSPPPSPHRAVSGETILPDDPRFSAFIFKIQANMDPKHRNRVAFLRICSGIFYRDMSVLHQQTGKKMRLASAQKIFGQDRETIDVSYPGDIIGLVGNSELKIGDTLTEDLRIHYNEIPCFPPECFTFIINYATENSKRYQKGLTQLLHEGVAQSFEVASLGGGRTLLGAVGPLQFEVLQYRLENEYGARAVLEAAPWKIVRWLPPEIAPSKARSFSFPHGTNLGTDSLGHSVIFFPGQWQLQYFSDKHHSISLAEAPPKNC